jgi:hypothetical protein
MVEVRVVAFWDGINNAPAGHHAYVPLESFVFGLEMEMISRGFGEVLENETHPMEPADIFLRASHHCCSTK